MRNDAFVEDHEDPPILVETPIPGEAGISTEAAMAKSSKPEALNGFQQKGEKYFNSGQHELAYIFCKEALQETTGQDDKQQLLHMLIECCLKLGHMEKALEHSNECIELDEKNAQNHVLLARSYLAGGEDSNVQKACESLECALDLSPSHKEAQKLLIDTLKKQSATGKQTAEKTAPEKQDKEKVSEHESLSFGDIIGISFARAATWFNSLDKSYRIVITVIFVLFLVQVVTCIVTNNGETEEPSWMQMPDLFSGSLLGLAVLAGIGIVCYKNGWNPFLVIGVLAWINNERRRRKEGTGNGRSGHRTDWNGLQGTLTPWLVGGFGYQFWRNGGMGLNNDEQYRQRVRQDLRNQDIYEEERRHRDRIRREEIRRHRGNVYGFNS